jgi:microsomal dipeptidase-like Zn-dependent dipeptidase
VTVVDVHAHAASYLPPYAAAVFRFIYRRTMPDDLPLRAATDGGVDVLVAKAIGDPLATNWWGRSPWKAVDAQLSRIEAETRSAGGCLVRTGAEIEQAQASGRLAVMLGLEGANAIGRRLERLGQLRERGVRVIVLVHLGHNQIGTTCLPWQEYIGGFRLGRPRKPGLTSFGRQVVAEMNRLGMVIDTSHADSATLRDILDCSSQPIIASHTGARSLDDFRRYLDDSEIAAIAEKGGLVGLWPYRGHNRGVADVQGLVRQAQHMAGIAGADHLCLGTDMNGVPGLMAGYRGEQDVPVIADALRGAGFDAVEVEGILGENFLRLLASLDG